MTELATPPTEQREGLTRINHWIGGATAEVAQDKRTAEDSARTYDRTFREIFQSWRNRKKL